MNKMAERLGLEPELELEQSEQGKAPQSDAVREFMARLAAAQDAEAAQPTLEEQREARMRLQQEEQEERKRIEAETIQDFIDTSTAESDSILKFTDLRSIKSLAELVSLAHDFVVHCFRHERRGVRLYEINRRFSVKAVRLGSNTGELARMLTRSGEISTITCRGVAVFYPTRDYLTHSWALPGVKEREDFKEAMLEASMGAMPSSKRTGTARRRKAV